jgi:hypothetical protein
MASRTPAAKSSKSQKKPDANSATLALTSDGRKLYVKAVDKAAPLPVKRPKWDPPLFGSYGVTKVTVSIPTRLDRMLEVAARALGMKKGRMVEKAVIQYLRDNKGRK